MKKKLLLFLSLIILTFALILISPLAYSGDDSQAENPIDQLVFPMNNLSGDEIDGFPVVLNDSTLFMIQESVGDFTPEERARTISKRLKKLAQDDSIILNKISLEEQSDKTSIIVDNHVLITITERDSQAARTPRLELANEYLEIIKNAIAQYRKQQTIGYLISASINSVIITLLTGVVFFIVNLTFAKTRNWLNLEQERHIIPLRFQNLELISAERLANILLNLIQFVRGVLFLGIIFVYIPFILSLFPTTRAWGQKYIDYFLGTIQFIGESFIKTFPNLVMIFVVIIITYYVNRFLKFIFYEIEKGNLSFAGFYPDWAQPTYNILKFFVIAIAVIFVFPYVPGSRSPAFQGVSVFLGILFSLGSSSAVSNIVAGIILTYTRAFQIGDQVKIGDISGDIEEKNLLVTRVRTAKNVLVTLPNSSLLSTNIINYSASARETKIPLVLSAKVAISYHTPWRKVHETLVKSAKATEHILEDPYPYVLQTSLNEFYISYELNVYVHPNIHTSKELDTIYSELYQNIQDKCYEANIELTCSQYTALRDGNHTTIPDNYLSQDYHPPSFRVESSNKS
ncbi:MscS Mechanosensitive ion channel [Gloeothece citriformis PCC 7424]|uniref:MscS Mechanosensitive ion channel n=1 Tax=Gloeothece citriformis (strain PCC 7424) TaxID=65393 RepID=B7KIS9_GLOC7|nr:mechanosensitive ion channel family protein [Gloeothece citriformis]ACK70765.1 MscS Mechanosensitive ion channel [Gloeothece citriformis PCC 7424]